MTAPLVPLRRAGAPVGPTLGFRWLDSLWLQVTGTLCNIACRHCFISCGPKADQLAMMSVEQVERALAEGSALGMRQVYFTGGEPLLHPDLRRLVDLALAAAPLTIVTNGILLDAPLIAFLSERFWSARYSLDLRVSLDGMSAAQNDPVRGRGTFDSVVQALRLLGAAGLSPVVTVVEHEQGLEGSGARLRFLDFVRGLGIAKARVKFLPLVRLGREERRTHGYLEADAPGEEPLLPEVEAGLLCASGRCVTAQGVYTCPLLVEEPGARLADTLPGSARPFRLSFPACNTCINDGLRCNT
jgi:AdoMet-dependent heme synthase